MVNANITNPFPLAVFPENIREIVLQLHHTLGYPVDYSAAAMLFAVSLAVGNTHRVQVKTGFQMSAVLYVAIVGRAGVAKSHPIKFALDPIRQQDNAAYKAYRELKKAYENNAGLSPKERGAQGIAVPEKPVWNRGLVGDFTLEALLEVHNSNPRGIGVHSDELAAWVKNFTRYNSGSEMEFWLSNWSGMPTTKDRVSSDPTLITMPFISVIGTIQNAVLDELAKDTRSQNGFLDRILVVAPEDLQKRPWTDDELPERVSSDWHRILSNLLELPLQFDNSDCPKPTVLQFSTEARNILFEWQNRITDECNSTGDDTLASIYSKLEVYAARFALILQMMYYATAEEDKHEIGCRAVNGAIQLIDYFRTCALKVRDSISEPKALTKITKQQRTLYDALLERFETFQAVAAGETVGMSERTVKNFLNTRALFSREAQGQYKKLL